MSDFNDSEFVMLKPADNKAFYSSVSPMLVPEEMIASTYKLFAYGVVFTNKRIIMIRLQELTKVRTEYISLPYNKIQAYSVAVSNAFGLNNELNLWCTGLGCVKLGFASRADALDACGIISMYVL